MKKKFLALVLASAMTLSLAACGGSGDDSKSGTDKKDGEKVAKVTTVMTSDPDTLDPGRADDQQKGAIVLEAQETLVRLIDGKQVHRQIHQFFLLPPL